MHIDKPVYKYSCLDCPFYRLITDENGSFSNHHFGESEDLTLGYNDTHHGNRCQWCDGLFNLVKHNFTSILFHNENDHSVICEDCSISYVDHIFDEYICSGCDYEFPQYSLFSYEALTSGTLSVYSCAKKDITSVKIPAKINWLFMGIIFENITVSGIDNSAFANQPKLKFLQLEDSIIQLEQIY